MTQHRTTRKDIGLWFNCEDYTEVQNFDLPEWYAALDARHRVAKLGKEGLLRSPKFSESEWARYDLERALNGETFEARVRKTQEFAPVLALGVLAETRETGADESARAVGWRTLAINSAAPREFIRREFDTWLEQIEVSREPGLPRRGRPGNNDRLTKSELGSWRRNHVLECLDIDAWAMIHGKAPLPHEALCGLFPDVDPEIDAKEWGRRARDKSQKALNSLNLLIHEVANQLGTG